MAKVKALLERHRCPVPFHAVRTRFLGALADPEPDVAPLQIVKSLWGGELPEFHSVDEANELLQTLVMGLWNEFTRYQYRRVRFRLTPIPLPEDKHSLMEHARVRHEEIEGFIAGLFGGKSKLALDPGSAEALDRLTEIGSLYGGMRGFAASPTNPTDRVEFRAMHSDLTALRAAAEREMQAIVIQSARLRRLAIASMDD
jgi:hypothetical protein